MSSPFWGCARCTSRWRASCRGSYYLKYGLSLVLMVIGSKMIANYFYGGKFVPTELALLVTAVLIGGSIALSLIRTRGMAPEPQVLPTGWVPGSPAQKTTEPSASTE